MKLFQGRPKPISFRFFINVFKEGWQKEKKIILPLTIIFFSILIIQENNPSTDKRTLRVFSQTENSCKLVGFWPLTGPCTKNFNTAAYRCKNSTTNVIMTKSYALGREVNYGPWICKDRDELEKLVTKECESLCPKPTPSQETCPLDNKQGVYLSYWGRIIYSDGSSPGDNLPIKIYNSKNELVGCGQTRERKTGILTTYDPINVYKFDPSINRKGVENKEILTFKINDKIVITEPATVEWLYSGQFTIMEKYVKLVLIKNSKDQPWLKWPDYTVNPILIYPNDQELNSDFKFTTEQVTKYLKQFHYHRLDGFTYTNTPLLIYRGKQVEDYYNNYQKYKWHDQAPIYAIKKEFQDIGMPVGGPLESKHILLVFYQSDKISSVGGGTEDYHSNLSFASSKVFGSLIGKDIFLQNPDVLCPWDENCSNFRGTAVATHELGHSWGFPDKAGTDPECTNPSSFSIMCGVGNFPHTSYSLDEIKQLKASPFIKKTSMDIHPNIKKLGETRYNLKRGDNYISIPLQSPNYNSFSAYTFLYPVLKSCDKVKYLENDTFKEFLCSPPYGNIALRPGQGLWIQMKTDDQLRVLGINDPNAYDVSLNSGDNFVGPPILNYNKSISEAFSGISNSINSVLEYNQNTKKLVPAQRIRSGKAYMINAKEDAVWRFN